MPFDSSMGHITPGITANSSGFYENLDYRELGLTQDTAMDSRKVLLNLIEEVHKQITNSSDKPTSFNIVRSQIQSVNAGAKFRQVYTISFDFLNEPTKLDLADD